MQPDNAARFLLAQDDQRAAVTKTLAGAARYAGTAKLPGLRIYPVNHAREGDDLADVLGAANPGDGALQAHAEAGVGDAAVAAEVEIPLEGLFR